MRSFEIVIYMQMRGSIQPGGFLPRPSSAVLNPHIHHIYTSTPIFITPQQAPMAFPIVYDYYEPHHAIPAVPPLQLQMERKYSGTLGSTYDYRPQLVYPNSQPFRKDLDRKLTTIQHEDLQEYQSRLIVRSSLPERQTYTPMEEQHEDSLCFNLCCVVLLVIGLLSLSLCIYTALSTLPKEATNSIGGPTSFQGGFLFLRQFNI